MESPWPGAEKLRFDIGPSELFKGQAVVLEKARDGHWRRSHDAGPAGGFLVGNGFQEKVHAHSHPNSQDRTEELPGGQAEEDGFLVLAHFLGDLNFHVEKSAPFMVLL